MNVAETTDERNITERDLFFLQTPTPQASLLFTPSSVNSFHHMFPTAALIQVQTTLGFLLGQCEQSPKGGADVLVQFDGIQRKQRLKTGGKNTHFKRNNKRCERTRGTIVSIQCQLSLTDA